MAKRSRKEKAAFGNQHRQLKRAKKMRSKQKRKVGLTRKHSKGKK